MINDFRWRKYFEVFVLKMQWKSLFFFHKLKNSLPRSSFLIDVILICEYYHVNNLRRVSIHYLSLQCGPYLSSWRNCFLSFALFVALSYWEDSPSCALFIDAYYFIALDTSISPFFLFHCCCFPLLILRLSFFSFYTLLRTPTYSPSRSDAHYSFFFNCSVDADVSRSL